jgi:hypothetical protein
MYYIGLDVHKKTSSYCVKDATGRVLQEGRIGSTRYELDAWIRTLPQPRTMAMEATISTGWIYDHLLPHAEAVKVAHPLMLRAMAATKKKNDRIDAGKIADCLRWDFLPECHIAPTPIRDRRRVLRYRNLVQRQSVQMKNRISGLLMETGVSYNKLRLHRMGYFAQLLSTNKEITASNRPLLHLCREHIDRSIRLDRTLLRSREQDPMLSEWLQRLAPCPALAPSPLRPGFWRWAIPPASVPSGRPSATAGYVARRGVQPTGCCAHPSPNSATSISSACWSKRPDWLSATAKNWRCCMNESGSAEMRTGPRSRWLEKWWLICWPWTDAKPASSREGRSGQQQPENPPWKDGKTSGSSMRRLLGPADYRPGRRRRLPRLSSNCFRTGSESHCAFSRTRPGCLCPPLTEDSHGCRHFGHFAPAGQRMP